MIAFNDDNGETPTNDDVNTIARQITYANSSEAPPSDVELSWIINDGSGTAQGSGGPQSGTGSVTVNITAVNDEEVLATNLGATVVEASTGNIITSTQLQTTDVDNTNAELVYTVNAVPGNGTLKLSGTALAANDTFTQADIDAGSADLRP